MILPILFFFQVILLKQCASNSSSKQKRKPIFGVETQKENPPSFITRDNFKRFDLEDRYLNPFTSYKYTHTISGDRSLREYYHCIVVMDCCQIYNSFAFGTGISVSDGGVMFLSSSSLIVTKSATSSSFYYNNSAGTGGAISCVDCIVTIDQTTFRNNTAFRCAGAISLEALVDIEIDGVNINRFKFAETECFITNCEFKNNVAMEMGGALFVKQLGTTYLQKCEFTTNKAGHSGGAVFASRTEPQFYECQFTGNHAGNRTTVLGKSLYWPIQLENGTSKYIANKRDVHRGGLARSGGAIAFVAIEFGPKTTNHSPFPSDHPQQSLNITGGKRFEMITNNCCFNNNWAFNEDGVVGTGRAVHLAGHVQYTSQEDNFDRDESSLVSVNQLVIDNAVTADRENLSATYALLNFQMNAFVLCEDEGNDISQTVFDKGTPLSEMKSNTSFNLDIPKPTSFTYQQTPITRLPFPTTQSPKYTEALAGVTFTIEGKPKTLTPARTISASPSASPTPSLSISASPSLSISSTPSVSASPSTSATQSASLVPSISASPFPTSLQSDMGSYTISLTVSMLWSKFETMVTSLTLSSNIESVTYMTTYGYVYITIEFTVTFTNPFIYVEESEQNEPMGAGLLIGVVTGCAFFAFFFIFLGIFFYRKCKEDDDSVVSSSDHKYVDPKPKVKLNTDGFTVEMEDGDGINCDDEWLN